jgi:methylglutamate dehydrogenase subunit D
VADLLAHSRPAFDAAALAARPGLRLAEITGLGIASVAVRRGGRADALARLRALTGLAVPDGPFCASEGGTTLLGTGPSSFLAMREGGGPDFAARLGEALGDAAAVADQSSAYAVLELAGEGARDLLQRAVAIDLHPRAFGPQGAAVTQLAHMGILLWQAGNGFRVAVFRSMAGSLLHALLGMAPPPEGSSPRPG